MHDDNAVIIQRLSKELDDYLAYLRLEYGYQITLHNIEANSNANWPQMLSYNYHNCFLCCRIKNSRKAWDHCIDRQSKIREKIKHGSFAGTCYAGVGEFVFPIQDLQGNSFGFLCVSGYTFDRANSLERACAAAKRYHLPRAAVEEGVAALKDKLPDFNKLKMQILPIQNLLSTLFYFNGVTDSSKEESSERKQLYYQMLGYVNNKWRDPDCSLKELCKHFNISYSFASHLFAEYNPLPFARYVRRCRLEEAKQYLAHTDCSISQVSQICGFSDSNYFSSTFKSEIGVTPSQYRAQTHQSPYSEQTFPPRFIRRYNHAASNHSSRS